MSRPARRRAGELAAQQKAAPVVVRAAVGPRLGEAGYLAVVAVLSGRSGMTAAAKAHGLHRRTLQRAAARVRARLEEAGG